MSNKAIDKDYLLRQLHGLEDNVLAQRSIASQNGYHNLRFYNDKFAYKNGDTWESIDWVIPLTQAEYDLLTSAEKNRDVFYYITDASSVSNEGDMKKSDYDGDRAIQAAGGIRAYVDGAVGTKQATLTFDNDYLVI